MDSDKPARQQKIRQRLRKLIGAGAGGAVLATTLLGALPAQAGIAAPNAVQNLHEKIEAVRAQQRPAVQGESSQDSNLRLAWWGNWHNWGWGRPGWPNWHNWHNWHNWGNW